MIITIVNINYIVSKLFIGFSILSHVICANTVVQID